MGKHPVATKHFAVVNRDETDGTNAVKKLLAQREVIDIRRRWPPPLGVDLTGVVHQVAEAGMGFQPGSVRHVHRVRDNIVDRGVAVRGGKRILRKICRSNPSFLGGDER